MVGRTRSPIHSSPIPARRRGLLIITSPAPLRRQLLPMWRVLILLSCPSSPCRRPATLRRRLSSTQPPTFLPTFCPWAARYGPPRRTPQLPTPGLPALAQVRRTLLDAAYSTPSTTLA